MGRGADDIAHRRWVLVEAGNHEADDMRDIGEEIGPNLARDLCELTERDRPRIGRRPDDQDARPDPLSEAPHARDVDAARRFVHAKMGGLVVLAGDVVARAVAVMAARRLVESEDAIAGLQKRAQHGDVGKRRRDALDVRMLRAEEALGAVDRQGLNLIEHLAARHLARARIAGRILGDEERRFGFEGRARA